MKEKSTKNRFDHRMNNILCRDYLVSPMPNTLLLPRKHGQQVESTLSLLESLRV